jgi:hypothetical protein
MRFTTTPSLTLPQTRGPTTRAIHRRTNGSEIRATVLKTGDLRLAARAVQRRGWQIFARAFHVEIVYGVASAPLHQWLSIQQAIAAFALFSLLMFGLVVVKDWLKALWKRGGQNQAPALAVS